MDKNYFKEYYLLERNHWWFKARAEILKSIIEKLNLPPETKILNVGVATGGTTELLQNFGEVTSVEFEHDCCIFLREELNKEVTEASITALPFDNNSYDLVCAFDVIEHVDEDQKAADELKRVCKPEGYVCCTVPAFNFLWSHHDDVNHHKRRYTLKVFSRLFKDKIIFSTYFNTILFLPVTSFRLLSRVLPLQKLRKGAGSDFTLNGQGMLSTLFYRLMGMEKYLLKKFIKLPAGISILLIWKK